MSNSSETYPRQSYIERYLKQDIADDYDPLPPVKESTSHDHREPPPSPLESTTTSVIIDEEIPDEPSRRNSRSIEEQVVLMPMIDSIVSDPLIYVLSQNGCNWVTKEPLKMTECGYTLSMKDDEVYIPFYIGRSIVCVIVSYDSNPIMIYEESFYGKSAINSGFLEKRKAWIVEKKRSEKQKKEKLPSKVICFRTLGMSFQFQG